MQSSLTEISAFSGKAQRNCLPSNAMTQQAGLEELPSAELPAPEQSQWFVLRDLKRPNSLSPAYITLPHLGITTFTPMHWQVAPRGGKQTRTYTPFIPDLLFVHTTRATLDPIILKTPTLQYRYMKGKAYCTPMTVPADEMQRFIDAVQSTPTPRYYLPSELTPDQCGKRVRIIGGSLDGYEGTLLKLRGARQRRVLISLQSLLAVAVEVADEYLQFL